MRTNSTRFVAAVWAFVFAMGIAAAPAESAGPQPRAGRAAGMVTPSGTPTYALPDATRGLSYFLDSFSYLIWTCATNPSPVFRATFTPANPVPGLSFASTGIISGTPTTVNNYSMSVDVTDISGLPGACGGTATAIYTLRVLPPVPICTLASSNMSPATGSNITLTATCSNSPTSYVWTNCTSTSSTCTTTSSSAGPRTYSVTATNAGGSGSASVTVTWGAPPLCTLVYPTTVPNGSLVTLTAVCSNNPTNYAWTGGCTPSGNTCDVQSNTPATRTFTMTATNSAGSSGTLSATVTWVADPPVCSLTAMPTTALVGSPVTLEANCSNGPTNYAWTGGCAPSGNKCVATSPTAEPRTYGVTASNGSGPGPQATIQLNWTLGPVPTCTISTGNSAPEMGTQITLSANCTNGPTSYSWSGCISTTSTCTASTPGVGPFTYTVKATNGNGTGQPASLSVNWQPRPTAHGDGGVIGAASGGGGTGFSALIRDTGTLWTWGDNSRSGLGDGSATSRSTPGQVRGLTDIQAATVGSASHTLALDKNGRVMAWGANTYGEVGNGTKSPQTRPVEVPLPVGFKAVAVAAGNGFSVVLLNNGTVYTWGRNHVGQLGDGTKVDRATPGLVENFSKVHAIAASGDHVAAVVGGIPGTVWVWGGNFRTSSNQSARPVELTALTGAVAVYAGGDNTFVIRADGSLWAFGNPDDGRLATGGQADGRTPLQVKNASNGEPLQNVQAVAAGDEVSMALLADRSLVGWGKNDRGQLGLGHSNVVPLATKLTFSATREVANATSGASNYIIDGEGRMFAAGGNEAGSLGLGDKVESRSPTTVPGLSGITAVAATPSESLALRNDGTVLSWGTADSSAALASTATPRQVPGLTGRYVAIAGGSQTAVAVRDDGSVFAWGTSVPGSTTAPVLSPVALPSLAGAKNVASGGLGVIVHTAGNRALIACGKPACPGPDFGFTDVVAVAAGESHFLVLRADKSVWAWGANDKGQLGNGGTSPAAIPVRVTQLDKVRSIAAGADFSLAVQEDGKALAWGLAPSFGSPKVTPTRVSGFDHATVLSASSHVLALDQAGRGKAWGRGSKVGERDHLWPGREPRMDGMKMLAAGAHHSLGITADGRVVAWGRNFQQQLAVPRAQAQPTFVEITDPANSAYTQGASPVVEFVNPAIAMGGKTNLIHYFLSAYPDEINGLDNGTTVKGWQRTGRDWRAWGLDDKTSLPVAGTPANAKPVYRFFSSRWNSHFYTAVAAEKDALIAKNPTQDDAIDWKLESTAFYAMTPESGCPSLSVLPRSPYLCTDTPTPAAKDCPAGYYPVYRAFSVGPTSTRPDPNHQFTSSFIDIYRNVRFAGYVYEGVAFCSPTSTQPGGDLQAYHTYPGDKVDAGKPMQSEFWFGNAGPGDANKATLVAALADGGNWTATCRAYNGAACPADLSLGALRLGVEAPSLPAGGVIHITAVGTAPSVAGPLTFTSSIGAPSGAPDPFASNNASPVTETAIVDTACRVTLSAGSLALIPDGASGSVLVDAPAGCAWSATSDEAWASIVPTSGAGASTLSVIAAPNGSPSDRLATVNVAAGAQVAPLAVHQPGVLPALPCPSVSLGRVGDAIGGNALSKSVNVVAPSNCTWQASPTVPWLAVTGMSALGTGQIEYAAQPNPDFEFSRTGLIVVTAAGKTLNVLMITQAASSSGTGQDGPGGGADGPGPGGDGGDGGGDGAGE